MLILMHLPYHVCFHIVFFYVCFFLKKLKWKNILPKESVPPSTRCTKEETQGLNNIYKGKWKDIQRRKKLLTYAQHGERTKPPAM